MPGVIRTEVAVILIVVAIAIGWALGQYVVRRVPGLSS